MLFACVQGRLLLLDDISAAAMCAEPVFRQVVCPATQYLLHIHDGCSFQARPAKSHRVNAFAICVIAALAYMKLCSQHVAAWLMPAWLPFADDYCLSSCNSITYAFIQAHLLTNMPAGLA